MFKTTTQIVHVYDKSEYAVEFLEKLSTLGFKPKMTVRFGETEKYTVSYMATNEEQKMIEKYL